MAFEMFMKTKKKKKTGGGTTAASGFSFLLPGNPANDEFSETRRWIFWGTTAAIGVTLIVLAIVARHATADFTLIVASLMTLCGLVVYDIVTRRIWEKTITDKVQTVTRNHDRLVREVARTRNDIVYMKEGFAEVAELVSNQGRRLPPSSSPEARMIETIISQLGSMGERPRADIQTKHDESILELEMNPPPPRMPPLTSLDNELVPDFSKFDDDTVTNILQNAVRNDRIDVFVQPIVSLPQRRPRMYEMFARLRAGPGAYMPAERYLDLAHKDSLMPVIDNLLLLRCLQMLRDQKPDAGRMILPYVLNISASTLHDSGFMGDLVAFLAQNKGMASHLIFELPQSEIDFIDDAVVPILDGLSKLGCRFSMDRVRNRRFDVNRLQRLHMRFIKIDAAWLITEGRQRGGVARINRLKKQLDAAGIDIVVEKIEKEADVRELLDYSVDYGQGYLFGKPDLHLPMRDVLKATA